MHKPYATYGLSVLAVIVVVTTAVSTASVALPRDGFTADDNYARKPRTGPPNGNTFDGSSKGNFGISISGMKRADWFLKIPEMRVNRQTWFIKLPELVLREQHWKLRVPEFVMKYIKLPGGGGFHVPHVEMADQHWFVKVPEVTLREQRLVVDVPEFKMIEHHWILDLPEIKANSDKPGRL